MINYEESEKILQSIKEAKKILINCHEHPDADSVSCALALGAVLDRMGKITKIVCPDNLDSETNFVENSNDVKTIDFSELDFTKYDLFFVLDTSSWDRASSRTDLSIPGITIVNIDHHKANARFGKINLIDYDKTSTAEILYGIFQDWGVKLDTSLAQYLLTGIVGDTGSFRFKTSADTLEIASKLMRLGADKEEITFHLFRNIKMENLLLLGDLLSNVKYDKQSKLIWTALPFVRVKKYGDDLNFDAIDMLLQSTQESEFGIRMMERVKGVLSVSFRARTDFDTSKIAMELGGGGHPVASGATIKGLKFEEAVEKVLKVARKYAK